MKKKNGFTLIELLAVIIILGILMIIAIPSVTRYISDSRKNAYIDTAKEIIAGARNLVNEGKLEMYDTSTAYYLPSSCIKTENASKSPYGEFVKDKTYVVVTYDGKGFEYFWVSLDETGTGIKNITSVDQLDIDDIESDLTAEDIEIGVIFNDKQNYAIIENDCKTYNTEEATFAGAAGVIYKKLNVETGYSRNSKLVKVVHDNGDVDYRYQGSSPQNFVRFNNELWRIIGIFDGKLKLFRYISLYQTIDTFNRWGSNAIWDSSDVKNYLNSEYYDTIQNEYKNMIDENTTWYLVGPSNNDLSKEQFYLAERNQSNVDNNYSFTSNTTKIGLIYPSDFGYAAYEKESVEDNYCPKNQLLSNYSITNCYYNNWINMTSNYTISKQKGKNKVLAIINQSISDTTSTNPYKAYPTLYLKKDVKIIGGDGTDSKPFILSYK